MFSQKQLLFMCACLAIIGTIAFALLSSRLVATQLRPAEITLEKSGELVFIAGRPSSVSLRASSLSFLLCDGECVSVRASRQVGEELEQKGFLQKLKEGNRASATGIVKSSGQAAYVQLLEANALEFFS